MCIRDRGKAEVLAVKEGLANNFQVLLKLTLANSGQSLVEVQSNRPLVPGNLLNVSATSNTSVVATPVSYTHLRQLHAPVAAGQAAGAGQHALVPGLVEEVAETGQNHPGGQQEHRQHRPVEIAEVHRTGRRQDRAGHQHRG